MIGGIELPTVRKSFAAFALGARSTNHKANTLVSYIGNRDDVSAGKEQVQAQISRLQSTIPPSVLHQVDSVRNALNDSLQSASANR